MNQNGIGHIHMKAFLASLCFIVLAFCLLHGEELPLFPNGETVIFPKSATNSQMASAVIITKNHKVIVFDGGTPGDSAHLQEMITSYSDAVDYWFITHPHLDHCGALIGLFENPASMKIQKIHNVLYSFPPEEWLLENESWTNAVTGRVYAGMRKVQAKHVILEKGNSFVIDGVRVEILNSFNLNIRNNPGNNASIVFSVSIGDKRLIFPGDIGTEVSDNLVAEYGDALKADLVLLSHHGQNGAEKSFYEKVNPTIAVWPTPQWLWDNDNGGGPGSGPWKTNFVKCWLQEIGVKKQYVNTQDIFLK